MGVEGRRAGQVLSASGSHPGFRIFQNNFPTRPWALTLLGLSAWVLPSRPSSCQETRLPVHAGASPPGLHSALSQPLAPGPSDTSSRSFPSPLPSSCPPLLPCRLCPHPTPCPFGNFLSHHAHIYTGGPSARCSLQGLLPTHSAASRPCRVRPSRRLLGPPESSSPPRPARQPDGCP